MQQASVVLQHQIGLLPPSGTPPGKQGSTQSPPDAHQLGLPFGADYEHGGRMLKPRIKRALEVVRKAFEQLAFPLFDFASPGNTTRLRGDDAVQPALGEEPEDLTLPKPAWSSDEVARLHGVLLRPSRGCAWSKTACGKPGTSGPMPPRSPSHSAAASRTTTLMSTAMPSSRDCAAKGSMWTAASLPNTRWLRSNQQPHRGASCPGRGMGRPIFFEKGAS